MFKKLFAYSPSHQYCLNIFACATQSFHMPIVLTLLAHSERQLTVIKLLSTHGGRSKHIFDKVVRGVDHSTIFQRDHGGAIAGHWRFALSSLSVSDQIILTRLLAMAVMMFMPVQQRQVKRRSRRTSDFVDARGAIARPLARPLDCSINCSILSPPPLCELHIFCPFH